jgi:hypothetical protein
MFEGLSKQEVLAWVLCLAFAVGLTVLGTIYLATSFMTADVSDALKRPDAPGVRKSTSPQSVGASRLPVPVRSRPATEGKK